MYAQILYKLFYHMCEVLLPQALQSWQRTVEALQCARTECVSVSQPFQRAQVARRAQRPLQCRLAHWPQCQLQAA